MNHTVIVTDSTSDIPPSLAEAYGIEVVPLTLMFGEESYRDGIDMTPEQFYERLPRSSQLPTTSQPSPVEYMNVYRNIMERYPQSPILSFHISSGLSGTYQSALLAKSMLEEEGERITVFDSLSASYGFGLLVVHAVRLSAEGKARKRFWNRSNNCAAHVSCIFWWIRLNICKGRTDRQSVGCARHIAQYQADSVHRPGRHHLCGRESQRTKKAVARMIELFKADLQGIDKINVAVGHTAQPEAGEEFIRSFQHFTLDEQVLTNVGPVVGSHVGNGTLAVFIWPA